MLGSQLPHQIPFRGYSGADTEGVQWGGYIPPPPFGLDSAARASLGKAASYCCISLLFWGWGKLQSCSCLLQLDCWGMGEGWAHLGQ